MLLPLVKRKKSESPVSFTIVTQFNTGGSTFHLMPGFTYIRKLDKAASNRKFVIIRKWLICRVVMKD